MFKWFKKNKDVIIAWIAYVVGCLMLVYVTDGVIEYMVALLGVCLIDFGRNMIALERL